MDVDEWSRITMAGSYVRQLEAGKKLMLFPVEYYDEVLKKYITGDFVKASKIITQFLSKEKEVTGDMFLLWRLKQLLPESGWEVRGEIKMMKDFELRDPSLPSKKKMVETVEDDSE